MNNKSLSCINKRPLIGIQIASAYFNGEIGLAMTGFIVLRSLEELGHCERFVADKTRGNLNQCIR